MNPSDFTLALEQQLQQIGQPFDRGQVIAFVEDCWTLIDMDPSPELWTDVFWEWQAEHAEAL